MTRRNRARLEHALEIAASKPEQAIAHFEFATFHDNNRRELAAIPHYRRALDLGLDNTRAAQALAWLASSLYKTGDAQLAVQALSAVEQVSSDTTLDRFLVGLRRRIERHVARHATSD